MTQEVNNDSMSVESDSAILDKFDDIVRGMTDESPHLSHWILLKHLQLRLQIFGDGCAAIQLPAIESDDDE